MGFSTLRPGRIFSFTIYQEANLIKFQDKHGHPDTKWEQREPNPQEVLDLAFETAKEKGADAITHFKISNVKNTINDGLRSVTLDGIEMSGLLIDRK